MSDDESPEPGSADEKPAPERARRKPKARPVVTTAKPVTRAPVVSTPTSSWTTGHLAAALALGLALGAGGGYLAGSKSGPNATAEAGKGAGSGTAAVPGANAKQQQAPAPGAYVPIAAWTPRHGPEQAKVTIVEFSDFQCPHCSKVAPVLAQVAEAYPGQVSVHFRHYPLPSHAQAEPAARAMQAAQKQDKGFQMADKIWGNMKGLNDGIYEGWAGELGLDVGKFKTDWASQAVKDEVAGDAKAGKDAGVRGTPTVFVNGKRHNGPRTLEGFKPVVDAELVAVEELIKAGMPVEKVYETRATANAR
jgi:protein-disulfide isomerase